MRLTQNQSDEICSKNKGNPSHFYKLSGLALFLAIAQNQREMGPKSGPGGSQIDPGGSQINPGGSKIDPGGSKIDPGLPFLIYRGPRRSGGTRDRGPPRQKHSAPLSPPQHHPKLPKTTPRPPKTAPRRPKAARNLPKDAPRRPESSEFELKRRQKSKKNTSGARPGGKNVIFSKLQYPLREKHDFRGSDGPQI